MATTDTDLGTDREHDPRDVAHLHEPADFDWVATAETVPLRNPRVSSVEAADQLILSHPEAPNVVRLDRVTTVLWRSFQPGLTVAELADDVADALDLEPEVALKTMTEVATNLGRAGFLTEPERPPILRRHRVFEVGPDSCAGKKMGLARVDFDDTLVFDLGPQLLRVACTDPTLVRWLAEPFADLVAAPDDPRLDEPVEILGANLGEPAPNRRSRLRLIDQYGTLWFSTFDRATTADALARAVQDRFDETRGGTWLHLPVLVPEDADPSGPVPALVLHPWLSLSVDRMTPGLRRAGVVVHPSPLVRYDATDGTFAVAASPRLPAGAAPDTDTPVAARIPTASDCRLVPRALAGVWEEPDLAQVIELFGTASSTWDGPHLDAVADLARRVPYRRIDATNGLRSTTAQLAALLLSD